MKNNQKIKNIVISAMFAAIIFVATAYLPKYQVANSGYVHIGDAFIYLAACFLPLPYAMAAASIGGTLADLLLGAASWAPFTFVIKALLVIAFTNKKEKLLNVRNFTAMVIAIPITTFGYYFAEAAITASFTVPVASLLPNFIQAAASLLIFIPFALALDRLGLKKDSTHQSNKAPRKKDNKKLGDTI